MYFPLVPLLVDKVAVLLNAPDQERRKWLASFMFILQGVDDSLLKDYVDRETEKRIQVFLNLIQRSLDEFEWPGKDFAMLKRSIPVSSNKFFTVGYVDKPGTIEDSIALAPTGLSAASLSGSRPKLELTKHASRLSLTPVGNSPAAKQQKAQKKKKKDSKKGPEIITSAPGSPATGHVVRGVTKMTGLSEIEGRKEALFVREISFTALDIASAFIRLFPRFVQQRDMFEKIWGLFITLLAKPQAVSFLTVAIHSIASFIPDFKSRLFRKANSVCPDLVYEVLRLCNSSIQSTRDEAATLFVVLFQTNFAETKNVDRVRLQAIIGIIKYLGTSDDIVFERLLASLSAITKHFKNNEPSIAQVTEQLDVKIRSIIADHKKMQQYEYDPEMIADLYHGSSIEVPISTKYKKCNPFVFADI
jgi:hypothetical protein